MSQNFGYKKIDKYYIALIDISEYEFNRDCLITLYPYKRIYTKRRLRKNTKIIDIWHMDTKEKIKETENYKIGQELIHTELDDICFYMSEKIAYWSDFKITDNYTGKYEKYHDNGQLAIKCKYVNGKLNGRYRKRSFFGQILLNVIYNNGKKHGLSKEYFLDDNVYHYYNNPKSIKKLQEKWNKEFIFKQTFYINDKKEGREIECYNSGKVKYQYNYVNDNLEGEQFEYYDHGKVKIIYYIRDNFKRGMNKSITNYKEGLKHGIEQIFHQNGDNYIESNYKNGLLDGLKILWDSDYDTVCLTYKNRYKEGKKHGIQEHYFVAKGEVYNGSLEKIEIYKNGELNGTSFYWSIDEMSSYNYRYLDSKKRYKKGKEHGKQISKYPDGTLESIENYFEGKRHGYQKYWFENGKLELKEKYDMDKRTGVWKEYDENGCRLTKTVFKEDKLISYQQFYF